MEIKLEKQQSAICLQLNGRLDTNASPEFQTALLREISANDEIILDLQDLEYVASSGLRAFLLGIKTATAQGKTLTFSHISEDVREILTMTGIWDFIKTKD